MKKLENFKMKELEKQQLQNVVGGITSDSILLESPIPSDTEEARKKGGRQTQGTTFGEKVNAK